MSSWECHPELLWLSSVRAGQEQLLPLAELPHGEHPAQPGKRWQSKNVFLGKIIPHGDVFLALSPCWGRVPAHRASALMGVSIPWCSSGPWGCLWAWGQGAVSDQGVLVPQSGSPGPGFLPALHLHAWGAAGGFPLLLKIRSKNSSGFWHGHRTGCRGNAAVGEEGGRCWVWAAWVAQAPHRQGDTGDNLSVSPRPSVTPCLSWLLGGAWSPPCSSFWGCWGRSCAQTPHVRPLKFCTASSGTAGAVGTWLCPGDSSGSLSVCACWALPVDLMPSSGLGLGCRSAPSAANRARSFLHPCRPFPPHATSFPVLLQVSPPRVPSCLINALFLITWMLMSPTWVASTATVTVPLWVSLW